MFFYPKAESTMPKPFLKDVSVIQGDRPVTYKLHRVKSHDQQQGCLGTEQQDNLKCQLWWMQVRH